MSVNGAEAVRKGHELNVSALEEYFRAQVPGFGGRIVSLLQFKSGQSNPTFYIKDDNDNEYVLRKKPSGKILPSAVRWLRYRYKPERGRFAFSRERAFHKSAFFSL